MPAVNLRPDEIERIRTALGREPSTVELHAFDAQWSEHCSYKSSRHFLKHLPVTGENVVVGVGQDAGIVHLGTHDGERYGIVIAHESHNHPSQVVPFEGAATGVGGIVRDVLCMGAEVIGLADALRFGDTSDPHSLQSSIADGIVEGVAAYGNAIGVPNIAGDVYALAGFDDNCLVNVIAMGIVKESEIINSYAPRGSAGWDLVLVGKATDPSGFGGASFSSVTLDADDAEANKGAVQVPDPFLKNVLMRASYRVFAYLRENKITAGFKDLGAGGIMGCSAEICSAGGFGAVIDLDDVNVAVEGMPPEVIAVGETQERLIWVLPPHVTADVLRIYNEEFTLPQIARHA
ncbi:MAG: AIR synthase related protein, partial [Candidatus Eremiobacteraeota bacterium]|nr:AIR synthase related protein [Candidatus Eremiobacteraeota bacterium]